MIKQMLTHEDINIDPDEMKLTIKDGPTISDTSSDHLTLEQLNIEGYIDIKVEQKNDRRHRRYDIGVFDENHSESHGNEMLKSGKISEVCSQEVNRLVNKLNGNNNAKVTLI